MFAITKDQKNIIEYVYTYIYTVLLLSLLKIVNKNIKISF